MRTEADPLDPGDPPVALCTVQAGYLYLERAVTTSDWARGSTGLLALAGACAVHQLVHPRSVRRRSASDRLWAPLALGWIGSASTVASGLSQHALAADASLNPSTSLLLALGTISGVMLGAAALLAIVGPPTQIKRRDQRYGHNRPPPPSPCHLPVSSSSPL